MSTIPMGIQPPRVESKMNALAQLLQLQGQQQQNALSKMQMGDVEERRATAAQAAQQRMLQEAQRAQALAGLPAAGQDPRQQVARRLVEAGLLPVDEYMKTIDPNFGRAKIASWQERAGATGRPEKVGVTDYGDPVGSALPQAVKLETVDLGGTRQAVDPYALKPGGTMRKTQTPDSIASTAVQMRGQNMTDARARERLGIDMAGAVGGNQKTGPMSVTLQKELLESDDTVQSAAGVVRSLRAALTQNDAAYSGYLAKPRAVLRSNLPGASEGADATIDVDNLMTGQGLESLKAIFGAAPTEGERRILMDMQASVDKTPAQRKAIMERAIAAADRRAGYAASKAKAIRDGSYLTQGVPPQSDAPASGGPVRVGSIEAARKLPPGTVFIDPQGVQRTR